MTPELFLAMCLAWRARVSGRIVQLDALTFQPEVGAESGTPHFQAWFWFSRPVSLVQLLGTGKARFTNVETGEVQPPPWGAAKPHVEEATAPYTSFLYARKPCDDAGCGHDFCASERAAPTRQGAGPLFGSATGKTVEDVVRVMRAAEEARGAAKEAAAAGWGGGSSKAARGGGGAVSMAVSEWVGRRLRSGWTVEQIIGTIVAGVAPAGAPAIVRAPDDDSPSPARAVLHHAAIYRGVARAVETMAGHLPPVARARKTPWVIAVVGEGGLGKSTTIQEAMEASGQPFALVQGNNGFYDTVKHDTRIIFFDEFKGSSVNLATIKQATATTGVPLNVKGSTVTCNATTWIFGSNDTPNNWFPARSWAAAGDTHYPALMSRISVLYVVTQGPAAQGAGMNSRHTGFLTREVTPMVWDFERSLWLALAPLSERAKEYLVHGRLEHDEARDPVRVLRAAGLLREETLPRPADMTDEEAERLGRHLLWHHMGSGCSADHDRTIATYTRFADAEAASGDGSPPRGDGGGGDGQSPEKAAAADAAADVSVLALIDGGCDATTAQELTDELDLLNARGEAERRRVPPRPSEGLPARRIPRRGALSAEQVAAAEDSAAGEVTAAAWRVAEARRHGFLVLAWALRDMEARLGAPGWRSQPQELLSAAASAAVAARSVPAAVLAVPAVAQLIAATLRPVHQTQDQQVRSGAAHATLMASLLALTPRLIAAIADAGGGLTWQSPKPLTAARRALSAAGAGGSPSRSRADRAAALAAVGLTLVAMGGDGNCGHRALAYFRSGNQDAYREVRADLHKDISDNLAKYSPALAGEAGGGSWRQGGTVEAALAAIAKDRTCITAAEWAAAGARHGWVVMGVVLRHGPLGPRLTAIPVTTLTVGEVVPGVMPDTALTAVHVDAAVRKGVKLVFYTPEHGADGNSSSRTGHYDVLEVIGAGSSPLPARGGTGSCAGSMAATGTVGVKRRPPAAAGGAATEVASAPRPKRARFSYDAEGLHLHFASQPVNPAGRPAGAGAGAAGWGSAVPPSPSTVAEAGADEEELEQEDGEEDDVQDEAQDEGAAEWVLEQVLHHRAVAGGRHEFLVSRVSQRVTQLSWVPGKDVAQSAVVRAYCTQRGIPAPGLAGWCGNPARVPAPAGGSDGSADEEEAGEEEPEQQLGVLGHRAAGGGTHEFLIGGDGSRHRWRPGAKVAHSSRVQAYCKRHGLPAPGMAGTRRGIPAPGPAGSGDSSSSSSSSTSADSNNSSSSPSGRTTVSGSGSFQEPPLPSLGTLARLEAAAEVAADKVEQTKAERRLRRAIRCRYGQQEAGCSDGSADEDEEEEDGEEDEEEEAEEEDEVEDGGSMSPNPYAYASDSPDLRAMALNDLLEAARFCGRGARARR